MRFYDAFPQATDKHITNTPDERGVRPSAQGLCRLDRLCLRGSGLDGLTLSPGKYWLGMDAETAFIRGRDQLIPLAEHAAARGIRLRIEPHVESVTWSPELALRMLD